MASPASSDSDEEDANLKVVTIVHGEGQLFVVHFHEDAVPPASMGVGFATEYKFEAARATEIEKKLTDSGFSIVRANFSSYADVLPEVVPGAADPAEEAVELAALGLSVAITGGAGYGKSTLLRRVIAACPAANPVVTSTTGRSAIELSSHVDRTVVTLHSALKLRVDEEKTATFEAIVLRIRKAFEFEKLPPIETLIIDEVSMLSDKLFELIVLLREKLWPKMQLVVCGDFAQLSPVGERFCMESARWDAVFGPRQIELTTCHRVLDDAEWVAALDRFRFAAAIGADYEMLAEHEVEPDEDLSKCLHVYPRRREAEEHNAAMLDALPAAPRTYNPEVRAYELLRSGAKNEVAEVYLPMRDRVSRAANRYTPVDVAVGARVMLLRNHLLSNHGVANGSTGTVTACAADHVEVRFDAHPDKRVKVTRTMYTQIHGALGPDKVKRVVEIECLPLEMAWACTVHKIQACTVDGKLFVDFTDDDGESTVFAEGQVYVVLSRVRRRENLRVRGARTLEGSIQVRDAVLDYYERRLRQHAETRSRERATGAAGVGGGHASHGSLPCVPPCTRDVEGELEYRIMQPLMVTYDNYCKHRANEYHKLKRRRVGGE